MRVKNHRLYAMFKYEQNPSFLGNNLELGDIVKNEENEIGVVIQLHGNDEYRTDMFGNCVFGYGVSLATKEDIEKFRPTVFTDRF